MKDKQDKVFQSKTEKERLKYLNGFKALVNPTFNAPSLIQGLRSVVAPTKPRVKKPKTPYVRESSLQIALVEWAAIKKLPLIMIPNEGKRTPWAGLRFRAMGLCAGVSDLFLARPSKSKLFAGMWIELKAKGKKPTQAQWDWILLMREEGYDAGYYDDLDTIIKHIEWYLAN